MHAKGIEQIRVKEKGKAQRHTHGHKHAKKARRSKTEKLLSAWNACYTVGLNPQPAIQPQAPLVPGSFPLTLPSKKTKKTMSHMGQ